MADRLLEPGHAFALERPAAAQGFRDGERLVVIDHDRDRLGQALADGPRDRDVLREGRIAEPQLHRPEARRDKLLGLVRGFSGPISPRPLLL